MLSRSLVALASRTLLAAAVLSAAVLTAARPQTVHAADQAPQPLLVLAAASLSDALNEIGTTYTAARGKPVRFSFAASSALARQVEAGARADVFFSADLEWMDYLAKRSLIEEATRGNVVGNALVLIAPTDSRTELKIKPGFKLLENLNGGKLATGDPDSVPVGLYARAALTSLGVWSAVSDHIARAENVRAALAYVARGESPLGIVYKTDALAEKRVRIVDTFPEQSHPPIVYPAAVLKGASPGAARFVQYLKSAAAQKIFQKYGFTAPAGAD